jgi:CBS domain-containing protein
MKARDIMRKRVLSVTPQTTLADLSELLAEHHVSGVPVLGAEGDLIGVVSQTDLLLRGNSAKTVAAVMTPWTVSFEEDTDVTELARQMLSKKIHRVIVTNGGRLSGIITSMDMVRALLVLLEPRHEGTHRNGLLE